MGKLGGKADNTKETPKTTQEVGRLKINNRDGSTKGWAHNGFTYPG